MRIRLGRLDPDQDHVPEGWTGVGHILSGGPPRTVLAYDPERRPHALVAGQDPRPLDPVDVNLALGGAVEEAAEKVWPGGWTNALPDAFGINKRTTARDRVERNGLHPNLLATLGDLADAPQAVGLGRILTALGRFMDEHAQASDVDDRIDDAMDAVSNAEAILRRVRRGKLFPAKDGSG